MFVTYVNIRLLLNSLEYSSNISKMMLEMKIPGFFDSPPNIAKAKALFIYS